jgi:hypothetical protein
MSKFRIKPYPNNTYPYLVQKRFFLIFWVDIGAMQTKEEAERMIDNLRQKTFYYY